MRWRARISLRDGELVEREAVTSAEAVGCFLENAEKAITRPREKRFRGRSAIDHWRGVSVIKAYENVHAAENFLVDLAYEEYVQVLVPSVIARAEKVLDDDDPHRQDVERLKKATPGEPIDRACFKQAMRAGFHAEDQIFLRIRNFRNLLVKCTALLFVLIAVMIGLVAAHPESMPLCFEPSAGTSGAPATRPPSVCPGGDRTRASGEDIWIVAGLGLLRSRSVSSNCRSARSRR